MQPITPICSHPFIISDQFIKNCKMCGVFMPKSGQIPIRLTGKQFGCDFLISDQLRYIYQDSMRLPRLQFPQSFPQVRSQIVDWLSSISDQLGLDVKTLHLAVYIVDRYVSTLSHTDNLDLKFIYLVSLTIASKAYELDSKIPSSTTVMRKYDGQFFPRSKFIQTEMHLLNSIQWEIEVPRFAMILEIFTSQGIAFEGELTDQSQLHVLHKYTDLLSLMCLQNIDFVNQNPYLVACAIVAAARKLVNIKQNWRAEFEELTGLQIIHFKALMVTIVETFTSTFYTQTPEKENQPSREVKKISPDVKPMRPQTAAPLRLTSDLNPIRMPLQQIQQPMNKQFQRQDDQFKSYGGGYSEKAYQIKMKYDTRPSFSINSQPLRGSSHSRMGSMQLSRQTSREGWY